MEQNFNEVLAVLSDKWMTTRMVDEAIDRPRHTALKVLSLMYKEGMVERKKEKLSGKDRFMYLWRLRIK